MTIGWFSSKNNWRFTVGWRGVVGRESGLKPEQRQWADARKC